ncbi:molybdenum ABC transporter [Escherichia phage vb_EcoM_bov10K1]|uniref:Molybdenum ABC transporter, periplasmic molybdenum-binding protein n=2 Tax=Tequatrovirus nbeco TaxID=2844213 RepID=A0A7H0XCN1_9CAUD|nr:molybdenum ABC transporter, periplasmic molybdenum-binding protein [Escherichia phage vb_EcoM_bov9_1]QOC57014.1 molybdenum ABC transporter [Escherichia phage vb_EcoM_bov10K1]
MTKDMTLEEAKAKANEALDLLLKIGSKIGSKMMEENEKYIQENKVPDGPLVGKRKSHD